MALASLDDQKNPSKSGLEKISMPNLIFLWPSAFEILMKSSFSVYIPLGIF